MYTGCFNSTDNKVNYDMISHSFEVMLELLERAVGELRNFTGLQNDEIIFCFYKFSFFFHLVDHFYRNLHVVVELISLKSETSETIMKRLFTGMFLNFIFLLS